MSSGITTADPTRAAAEIHEEILALQYRNTPNVRKIRKQYSNSLRDTSPEFMLELAWELLNNYGDRWIAYELIAGHKGAYSSLNESQLEKFGRGIHSWDTVDSFARTLSGPA